MPITTQIRLSISLALAVLLVGCDRQADERSTTQKTMDEMQRKYDELVEEKLENPVDWATDDLENIGDWEYKIIEISFSDIASMEKSLDELGNDRWEVFWIENVANGYRIMLKRPSRSYLSRIPLSQIGRMMIGGSGDEE